MKLKWLKDKLGEKFYPIAHATGVVVVENKTLDSKLDEIDAEIGSKANKTEIPTELPANGGNSATVNGHTVKSDVPENAVFTDTVYDYSALLGYDIYNLVSLKDAIYPAQTWLSKDFIAPFDGYVFFMVQTDGTSGQFTQVLREDDVLISDNQKDITDFNIWGCAYYTRISKGKTYHFESYNNATTAFNKVMLCIRKKFEIPTEYISYAPSNVALAEENTSLDKRISDNGCGEVAGGKNLANFSKLGMKTSNGITFEYQSNGSIKVSGTVLNKDDNVYTPLNLTKTRLSKGYWYTASVKSSNPKSIAKLFFTDKGSLTTFQASETADVYYYLQFFDGVEGKIPAGTVIDEILYPQIEEGKVVTEYESYFPSNKMLARDVADLRSSIYSEKEISLSKAQLIRNGSYSDINIISSLFLFGANGKFGLSRGYISLSIPVSFSKKDEIYIKLPYKQYGYKKDDLLPYIYKTVFCTQGDLNGKIIGTCNLSYYSGSDDEGISLTIDINDNYSFTDDNISSAYVDLRF